MTKATSLLGVQYLRAIAALMVAYFHLIGQRAEYEPILKQYLGGEAPFDAGVDIFFVISGFIMFVTSRKITPRDFMIKRLIRIVPLYWILTLCAAAAAFLSPEAFKRTIVEPGALLLSLLFIPFSNPNHEGHVVPLLVPGWSLNFEMFFYIVFAGALLTSLDRRLIITGAVFVVLLAVAQVIPDAESHPVFLFFANPRVLEFWLGMLIGWLYLRSEPNLSQPISWAIILIGAWVLMLGVPGFGDSYRGVFATIPAAAAIVLGTVALERSGGVRHSATLLFLGDASYSIYLSHVFALGAARALWGRLYHGEASLGSAIVFALISMILVIIAAALIYRLLEKPIQHALQHVMRSKQAVVPAT